MGSEKKSPPAQQAEAREQASRLFQEHEDFIRSAIRFAIRNPSETDDFYQDLYLSFVLNPPVKPIQKPQGFFWRLVMERATDWYRNQGRRRRMLKELYRRAQLSAEQRETESTLSDTETIAALFEQIKSFLKTGEGQAIIYRYKYHYTLEETAQKMGIKPQTVIRYVCTGLKKIRERFQNRRMQL